MKKDEVFNNQVKLNLLYGIIIGAGIAVGVMEWKNTVYECPSCHTKFKPKFVNYVCGIHTFNKRFLTCPSCKEKHLCKGKVE